jgi:hypothetical protein
MSDNSKKQPAALQDRSEVLAAPLWSGSKPHGPVRTEPDRPGP